MKADTLTVFLGEEGGIAHFAIDVSGIPDQEYGSRLRPGNHFIQPLAAAHVLSGNEAAILAQGRALLEWHNRHQFCGRCGGATALEKGGHQRHCVTCGELHFPRIDPVVIMLITHDDQCLLGQAYGPLADLGMYSALAGFIEQGESIEEAVRRETKEEAGIDVGDVTYHSSQPWPFPYSLMVGCFGAATSRTINSDPTEMNDVRWFERKEIINSLNGRHSTLKLPGTIAIAHHLIKAWATEKFGTST